MMGCKVKCDFSQDRDNVTQVVCSRCPIPTKLSKKKKKRKKEIFRFWTYVFYYCWQDKFSQELPTGPGMQ